MLTAAGVSCAVLPVTCTVAEVVTACPDIRQVNVYEPGPSVAVICAVVAGPRVSISATTPPLALTSVISPAWADLLCTVNVCGPVRAADHSLAQPVLVTVTAVEAEVLAAGSAAIVRAAATAGATTRTPATAHGRRAASRSQRVPPAACGAAGRGVAAG